MHSHAKEIIRLDQEIRRCLTVVTLFLIGAVLLLWTKAVEGFELIFGEISLKRQQFHEILGR